MKRLTSAAMLPLLLVLATCNGGPAFAADNVVTNAAIDLSPILMAMIGVAATIISAIGVPMFWALWTWLQNKTHLSALAISDSQKAVIDQGLQKAIAYGVARTTGAAAQLAAQGSLTVETKSAVVTEGLKFADAHIPDALAHFGLSLEKTPDALVAMIEARLGLLAIGKATNPVSAGAAMATDPTPAAVG